MSVHIKKREIIIKGGRNRAVRPKTYATEEKAQAAAKEQKLKSFTITKLSSAKFRIDA